MELRAELLKYLGLSTFVVVDLETTGLSPDEDTIIEIGAIKFVDGVEVEVYETLINPSRPIPDFITRLTGISDEDVKDAPTIDEAFPKLDTLIKDAPFIAVNTGSIPKDLISSELFGHVKGAFTGAIDNKKGRFEEANGGTLFLDEISSMSEQVQIALLRVLENNKIDRVGGKGEIPVDVRIVAATNERMEDLIAAGKFREDLYYRLNVYAIDIPALRERTDDIPLIANYFIDKFNKQYNKEIDGFEDDAIEALQKFSWPGNIRELRNIVLRAMISAKKRIKKMP